jgi:hypothetical protein
MRVGEGHGTRPLPTLRNLPSSPAKAGDPVHTVISGQAQMLDRTAIAYWMPAFAGMTPLMWINQQV